MNYLVGSTGFVGQNLASQFAFDGLFNSKNIPDAFEKNPQLLIYSGMRAEKFLAAKDPFSDKAAAVVALENIQRINPKKLVLISTIDVYKKPVDVDEDTPLDTFEQSAYGANRAFLEQWVKQNVADYTIIRLPALFGKALKKNFVYDLIHILPSLLKPEKFSEIELLAKGWASHDFCGGVNVENDLGSFDILHSTFKSCYTLLGNGFYGLCADASPQQRAQLLLVFELANFSALNFTDSRAVFPFYNLNYLFEHIKKAIENNLRVLNLATEPVSAAELYLTVNGKVFENILPTPPPFYDFKSKHCELFGGKNGYIFSKEVVLQQLVSYINKEKGKLL